MFFLMDFLRTERKEYDLDAPILNFYLIITPIAFPKIKKLLLINREIQL